MKKAYKRNFLKKVIVRIDFEEIDIEDSSKVIEIFKKEFPITQKVQGFEGSFTVNMNTKKETLQSAVTTEHKKVTVHQFSNTKKDKKCQFSSKYLG